MSRFFAESPEWSGSYLVEEDENGRTVAWTRLKGYGYTGIENGVRVESATFDFRSNGFIMHPLYGTGF